MSKKATALHHVLIMKDAVVNRAFNNTNRYHYFALLRYVI